MKAALFALVFAFVASLSLGTALAADKKEDKKAAAAGKDVTLAGEMVCAKCALKEAPKCQNVLKVTEGGKDVKYYLVKNKTSDDAHGKICSGGAKATVKGTVADEGGKKTLTASEIKYE